MKGMVKGLITGAVIGGTAATMFGVMNWQTERRWNQKMRQGGKWMAAKTDQIMKKL